MRHRFAPIQKKRDFVTREHAVKRRRDIRFCLPHQDCDIPIAGRRARTCLRISRAATTASSSGFFTRDYAHKAQPGARLSSVAPSPRPHWTVRVVRNLVEMPFRPWPSVAAVTTGNVLPGVDVFGLSRPAVVATAWGQSRSGRNESLWIVPIFFEMLQRRGFSESGFRRVAGRNLKPSNPRLPLSANR